jgi:hypothetical protein
MRSLQDIISPLFQFQKVHVHCTRWIEQYLPWIWVLLCLHQQSMWLGNLFSSTPDWSGDVRTQELALINHLHKYNHTISWKKHIGSQTTSNHCRRHGRPSLYSFEGKMTQPTKRAAPILKRTFLGDFGNNNDQSFCNVHNHLY